MSKITTETLSRWKETISQYLETVEYDLDDVVEGSLAWIIAHKTGIVKEAYEDRTIVDAHIKTALQKIFPNAIFKDIYNY